MHSSSLSQWALVSSLAVLAVLTSRVAAAQIDDELCVFSDRISILGEPTPISIAQRDGLLFASNREDELVIYNIDDPQNVTRVGIVPYTPYALFPYAPISIVPDGDELYITTYGVGLEVFDISDPANPAQLALITFGSSPFIETQGGTISGDMLYLADARDLYTFDITNPASPMFMAETSLPLVISYPELAVVGDHLYAAGYQLAVYDISSPHAPTLVNTLTTPANAWDCIAHPNGLYVANSTEGLLLYDLTDPASPEIINTLALPAGAGSIAAQGSTLAVASTQNTLHTVDVSAPLAPEIVRTTKTDRWHNQLALRSGYIFGGGFVSATGMVTYKAEGPPPPQPIIYESGAPGELFAIAQQGNLFFRATDQHGIQIYDISDPENTNLLSAYGDTFDYTALAVVGNFMLTTEYSYGFRVVDIADPSSPVRLSGNFGEQFDQIQTSGGRAYVTDRGDGPYELDLTNPASPIVLKNPDYRLRVADFAMQGTTAYIIQDDRVPEILVYDLADPLMPSIVGQIVAIDIYDFNNEDITDIAVRGDRVYLADEEGLLWIIDVSDLSATEQYVWPVYIDDFFREITIEGDTMVLSGAGMDTRVYNFDEQGRPFWLTTVGATNDTILTRIKGQSILGASDNAISVIDLGGPCAPDCPADTNGDGSVTPADFSAWVAAFNAQAPACDQNNDGSCSPADFSAWVANYNAGC